MAVSLEEQEPSAHSKCTQHHLLGQSSLSLNSLWHTPLSRFCVQLRKPVDNMGKGGEEGEGKRE